MQTLVPDQPNRSMVPFALAFCAAVLGGAIDAIGWSIGTRWLAVAGFIVGAAGVATGIALVVLGQLIGLVKLVRKLRGGK